MQLTHFALDDINHFRQSVYLLVGAVIYALAAEGIYLYGRRVIIIVVTEFGIFTDVIKHTINRVVINFFIQ